MKSERSVNAAEQMHKADISRPLAAAMGLAVMLAGCATLQPRKTTDILWPEPPLTPRIRFVGLLRNQADLAGASETQGDWLKEALLGRKQPPSALRQPMGLALSRNGKRLYVTDYAAPGVLVFDLEAKRIQSLGGEPTSFKAPFGIALDEQDNVYVVDSTAKRIAVFGPSGQLIRSFTHESLERPTGIAVDSSRRRIYVADSSSVGSRKQAIRMFDLDGTYLDLFGRPANAEHASFFPTYLALDARGNLYATDTLNAAIQVFTPGGEHLKTIGERGDAYGMFDKPKGVTLDSFGNVYVVDSAWSNVQIFNERSQVLLFFGGRGYVPGLLFNPTGIAIDPENRIYVADAFNSRIGMYQLINTKAEDSVAELPSAPAGQASSP